MSNHKPKELPGGGAQSAKQSTHEGAAIVTPTGAVKLDANTAQRLVVLEPKYGATGRSIRRQIERDYIKEQKRLAKRRGAA